MTLRDGERRSPTEQLELPLSDQPASPVAGKVLRTTVVPPAPPRIPAAEQRLIRVLAAGALIMSMLTTLGALTIDPVAEPTRALGVAGSLALTVTLGLIALLQLRSFHGHPGVWRVRRRRSLRRGLFAGGLIGGYLALRIIGLGGPTGLFIAIALVAVAEAAISRAEIDSV